MRPHLNSLSDQAILGYNGFRSGHLDNMTNFTEEKEKFRSFYDENRLKFEKAKDRLITLLEALLSHDDKFTITKVEGRVKDREECIGKFTRKYRGHLEATGESYEISNHISDLLGIRVVCLYGNEVDQIVECLKSEFEIINVTDKTFDIESTEGSFGYKGVHVDLRLNSERQNKKEYSAFSGLDFEIQVRSIIQDAWSAIDHKIKYKKSIPSSMKRRVNLLAAMFELADREFLAIKELTDQARESEENNLAAIDMESATEQESVQSAAETKSNTGEARVQTPNYHPLDAFSFLRIANHFFPNFTFDDYKVDGFVHRITDLYPGISRGRFNYYMRETISRVKEYRDEKIKEGIELNAYTVIRHCLFMADPKRFEFMLNDDIRANFQSWLAERNLRYVVDYTNDSN